VADHRRGADPEVQEKDPELTPRAISLSIAIK